MLYSKTLLFIHPVYSNLHLLTSDSQPAPPPLHVSWLCFCWKVSCLSIYAALQVICFFSLSDFKFYLSPFQQLSYVVPMLVFCCCKYSFVHAHFITYCSLVCDLMTFTSLGEFSVTIFTRHHFLLICFLFWI